MRNFKEKAFLSASGGDNAFVILLVQALVCDLYDTK